MSTHRSSKGKGRAVEEDYAESLASLSLSDCGDPVASGSDPYGSSYTDMYGSSYGQPYPGDNPYSWMAQSSLAPMQSSSAAYGGTPGYRSSYSTTPATGSMGGYEHRSGPSGTSSYGGYTGCDTASVTSSSVSSSYGGGSVAGWSDTQSRGTAASSAPSTHSHRTDVNNTIHRQRPPNERYQLPCEFRNLTRCDRVFSGDDEQGWMNHVEEHLQSNFPTRLRCWFCSDHPFDARETSGGDVRSNFIARMQHIRDHFVYDNARPEQMQKDGYLVKHLFDHSLIDRRTYESIITPTTVPSCPGSQGTQGRHRSHRSHDSHRHLAQVEEEEVVAGSSSRHQHRSEHRREHRDHGSSSHKQKHRRS